jgi:hypothetical protein
MLKILNEELGLYSKEKKVDLELLLNRISSVFKPIEDEPPEDKSLHAALLAQVRKNEYRGTQGKDRGGLKSSRNSRPERAESESDSKLTNLKPILDLKAEIGICARQPLHQCRISSYKQ